MVVIIRSPKKKANTVNTLNTGNGNISNAVGYPNQAKEIVNSPNYTKTPNLTNATTNATNTANTANTNGIYATSVPNTNNTWNRNGTTNQSGNVTNQTNGTTTSGNGQGALSYDSKTGNYVRMLNGYGYTVTPQDSRYQTIANEYAARNGGLAAGGTAANPVGWEQVLALMNQNQSKAGDALNKQVEAAKNTLKAGLEDNNKIYDDAQKAAYTNYMLGQKNLNQQLAASGLGKTGASESTRLGEITNYNNMYNSNEAARAKAARDIYNQMAQLEADTAVKAADLANGNGSTAVNAYMTLLANQQQQANTDREYQYNKALSDNENTYNLLNLLMSNNATSGTVANIIKQLYPNLGSGDLNYYNSNRLYEMLTSQIGAKQAQQTLDALNGNK